MIEQNESITISRLFRKALTTNSTSSSFPSKIPTVTEPTNDGVIDFRRGGANNSVPQFMQVLPYGLGSDEDAFSLRILGWRHIGEGPPQGSPTWLWVPVILAELTCTLGTAAGIAGAQVLNTELFADTLTIVSEPTITAATTRQGTVDMMSPANNTPAWFSLALDGHEKIEFVFDQTTNTPTMNALVSFF